MSNSTLDYKWEEYTGSIITFAACSSAMHTTKKLISIMGRRFFTGVPDLALSYFCVLNWR